ncbi:SsrA-binding protein SmpB [Candidatus Sumerlaeota bacterium]|nr:SsrA-binding protein SmpB [Candidatus Sumerlaeota bacterium]MBI3734908.1 SsrA-binding protein SmpB [Candidatus Sumerlaeota bacterium]
MEKNPIKNICQNRKARHLYEIEETFEAGLVLKGTEVKSLRAGMGSLGESYAQPQRGEIFLINFHIPPYEHGNIYNVEATRSRKLLLHKREIEKLTGAVTRKGYTLVPLSVYFKKGRVKVEVAIGRGKKEHDKREDLKKRDQEREMRRTFRKSS